MSKSFTLEYQKESFQNRRMIEGSLGKPSIRRPSGRKSYHKEAMATMGLCGGENKIRKLSRFS